MAFEMAKEIERFVHALWTKRTSQTKLYKRTEANPTDGCR
jgi:hypothetical protein